MPTVTIPEDCVGVVVLVSKDPEGEAVVKIVNLGEGEDDATEHEVVAESIAALAVAACDLTDEAIEAGEETDETEEEEDEPKPS